MWSCEENCVVPSFEYAMYKVVAKKTATGTVPVVVEKNDANTDADVAEA